MSLSAEVILPTIAFIIPIILHTVGIYVLYKARHNPQIHYSQRLYYFQLSIAVLGICVFGIAIHFTKYYDSPKTALYLTYLQLGLFCAVYYGCMVCMTLDRFFLVYLNIRYPLYWSEWKTVYSISSLWIVGIILAITFTASNINLNFLFKYLFPPMGILFTCVVLVTYSYIFYKLVTIRKRTSVTLADNGTGTGERKNEKTSVFQKLQSESSLKIKKTKQKFNDALSTWLLVVTFVFFMVAPDFSLFYYNMGDMEVPKNVSRIGLILRVIGFISDAFIYIFSSKPHRKVLKNMVTFS